MKRAHKLLVLVALMLALTTMMPAALAYFTTNASQTGATPPLQLGSKTTVTEQMDKWTKVVTISNAGPQEVFVRVKVFADVATGFEAENWTEKQIDGWYYYNGTLGTAPSLTVQVPINNNSAPVVAGNENALPFDVTVVVETTPVQFGSEGQQLAPTSNDVKWDLELIPPETQG